MKYNRHHIIWKSQREKYNISDPRNISVMRTVQHNWLHALFHTLNTPHEQFEFINWLWKPIQSKLIKELIKEINNVDIEDWYAPGIVK